MQWGRNAPADYPTPPAPDTPDALTICSLTQGCGQTTEGRGMTQENSVKQHQRKTIRRKDDVELRKTNWQYRRLMDVGQLITSEVHLEELFGVIIEQTNLILHAERSTLFLYDRETDELWSLVATGMGNDEIRIPSDSGIAGWSFQNRTLVNVDDAYADERFNSSYDEATGFRTRNLLCLPISNRQGEQIGVIQALNKEGGVFTTGDISVLSSLSNYMAIALENASLLRDIQQYSKQLEETLLRIETLNRVKSTLTKFVPHSVQQMVESQPDGISLGKQEKDVSVLFVDIAGFSAITEQYDPLLVNDMVERHFSAYLDRIQQNNGEVNETVGDGLMVLFETGASKDHAAAALRAGLAIVAENRWLNTVTSYPWGDVQLHLGVNTGTALVGCTRIASPAGDRYTYTASGMVTVLASRIASLSSNSELYCGGSTMDLVGDVCVADALGRKKVKNVEEEVPVFRVQYFTDM